MIEEKAATLWTGPGEWFVRILRKRRRVRMSEFDIQSIVNQINGCTDDEKRLILSQIVQHDIDLLMEAVIFEIRRLKQVEDNGKRLFGV